MKNKILSIGPVTKDHIITPHDSYSQIGGAVYYQTMTLTQLEQDATSIITIGKNDTKLLNNIMKKQEIILKEKTQEYTNIYDTKLNRTQKAILPENTIHPQDIKINLTPIKYALISPLSPEDIPPETIQHIKQHHTTTILLPQGYLRKTDKNNNITQKQWNNKEKYLKHTDIICLDKKEAKTAFNIDNIKKETINKILNKYNLQQVIITLAEKGSKIYTKNETIKIPAIKTTKNIDATGLGDTYIAAYITKLQETRNIREAGLFASITAKEKLENKGPLQTNKEKIEEELDKYI